MATVTGQRGTGNVAQGLRKIDMADKILLLEPDAAPLTVLSKRLSKRPTSNPEYKWSEDALAPRFDAINAGAGYASGILALVVDNGAYFAQHDLVYVTRTGELMRVTSVAGNTINVVRGVGSTAAALVDNDELLITSSAQPEGDSSKPARSDNASIVTNYTQIIRTPFDMTRTMYQSDVYTQPHDWEYQANKAGIEHKKSIEYAVWFGRPSEDLTGSQPRRTTGGVFHYVQTNVTDAGGQLTEGEFFNALRPAFRYGSNTKFGFASGLAVDVLNQFPRTKVQVIEQAKSEYGLDVMRYISPHGTLNVVRHWLLEGTKFGGYIAILDLAVVSYRYLGNQHGSSDTQIHRDIQATDVDGKKDEYLTECGLQFGQDKMHALLTGITSGPQA